MDIAKLGYSIDSSDAVRASKNLDGMDSAARRAQSGSQKMSSAIERDMARVNKSINEAKKVLAGYFSVRAALAFAQGLSRTADEYANIAAKIRLVTGSGDELVRTQRQIFEISQRTFTALNSTATLVSRTQRALVSNGALASDALAKSLSLAETINKSFAVSGATQQEAQNAIIQLSQGLAAGALRGEEYNSIAEQGSRITQALSKSLGVNAGELRKMAAEGKLTAEVIIRALTEQSAAIDAEFAQLPLTIGRSIQLIENSWLSFIGSLDASEGASVAVAGYLRDIAKALDLVGPQLIQLAASWGRADDKQREAADGAQEILQAMKAVVTGLLLAKNAVDVLVDGFRFMVQVGIMAASEIVSSFEDVSRLPGIIKRALNPLTAREAAEEYLEIFGNAKSRLTNFISETGVLAEEFGKGWDTNIDDVTNAFEFMLTPAERVAEVLKEMAESGEGGPGGLSSVAVDAKAAAAALKAIDKEITFHNKLVADSTKSHERQRKEYERLRLRFSDQMASLKEEIYLLGLSGDARERAAALLEAERIERESGLKLSQGEREELEDLLLLRSQLIEQAGELQSILGQFENSGILAVVDSIKLVSQALDEATDPERIATLQAALGKLNSQLAVDSVGSFKALLGAAQAFTEQGSNGFKKIEGAMAALSIIQDILALKAAVTAVLTQGQGDPYSAPVRMAAMLAAVAPFIASIGVTLSSLGGGGFSDTAADRQAAQGRGSVLGDLDAQSESIRNSTEITADATSRLVGINTGMLRALQSLQSGINGASGQLARGAGDVDFTGIGSPGFMLNARNGAAIGAAVGSIIPVIGTAIGFVVGGILGSVLGGSSRTTDQGLVIGGGSLRDSNVQAYQDVQSRSWRFGSRRTQTGFGEVSEELQDQFQLVIDSISNTVREGAIALGLLPSEIEDALANYQIEVTRISLMGLNAEEQQAALAAVFSTIFDGLAGNVVPWVGQFQQVGEGLGETLIRVATGVQVVQEGMRQLGFSLDEVDPERFAQASEGLLALTGGIDGFISGMADFVGAFADDDAKFEIALSAITRAFEQVGITIPATREAMWDLMDSLDATTESGQQQIATLLRLAGVSDQYYTLLENRTAAAARAEAEAAADIAAAAEAAANSIRELESRVRSYADIIQGIDSDIAELTGGSDYQRSLADIGRQLMETVDSLNAAARAAGLQSASEDALGRAHTRASILAARALAALTRAGMEQAEELYGSALSDIDARIAALNESTGESLGGFANAITEVSEAASAATQLLLGDLSPLKDAQKLPLALEALRRGEIGGEDVLRIAQNLYASGADYNRVFEQVQRIVAAQQGVATTPSGPAVNTELLQLQAEREALLAEQAASDRFSQAQVFAQTVADIAGDTGDTFEQVLSRLTRGRVTLEQFATDLQLDGVKAVDEYLRSLQAQDYGVADIAQSMRETFEFHLQGLREIFGLQDDYSAVKPSPTGEMIIDKPGSSAAGGKSASSEETMAQHGETAALLRELIDRVKAIGDSSAISASASDIIANSSQDAVSELQGVRAELINIGQNADGGLPRGVRVTPVRSR